MAGENAGTRIIKGQSLSDAWVVAVVSSSISGEERQRRFPDVFTQKSLKTNFVHKGQAAKSVDNKQNSICLSNGSNTFVICPVAYYRLGYDKPGTYLVQVSLVALPKSVGSPTRIGR